MIDFWFCYVIYAGARPALVLALAGAAATLTVVAAFRLRGALADER